jgi:Bacterial Ig domain
VQLTANTATTTGVQYLIDGQPLGSLVTTSPYTLSWNTTTVPNGNHWLAAQTMGPTGRVGTSPVVSVTVSSTSTAPPIVTLTSPTAGSTVSGSTILSATVASSNAISTVSFFVDNLQVGMSLTAPPYVTYWNTEATPPGQHTITVSATNVTGQTGTSAPVMVTVDNSNPPNVIGKDATVSVDGAGLMQTPKFATTGPDLLVAFVSYDGPSNGQQTATVSGAGLNWVVVERSNNQLGDAEIWSATSSDPLTGATVMAQPGVGTSYHGSLTVIAFSNASGPGIVARTSSPSGAPDCPLPGIAAGNWVFAVGNDWDNPIARVPVSGQVLVHQRVDTQVGDTYWVQSTTVPSSAYALVDIHDSSPTADQWNYAAIEIVATRP